MIDLADPGNGIEWLAKFAWRAPKSVLRNPAWQLSVIADPEFLTRVSDRSLRALVSCPEADPAFLAAAADACRAAPVSRAEVTLALASRADIPQAVLERLSPSFGATCTRDGREIAVHRLRTGVDSLSGWDAAIAPTLIPGLRSRPSKCGPPALDAVASLMRHGLLSTRCPMVRAVVQLAPRETRTVLLANCPRDDFEFLRLAARTEVSGEAGRLPDRELWAEVLGAWHGVRAGEPFPPRMRASGFAEGMGGSAQSQRATALARQWAGGGSDRILSWDWHLAYERRRPAPARAVEEACRAPRNSAAHLLALTVPKCPEDLLEQRSRSRSWRLRAAVACNPGAPQRILDRLREDLHWIVRGAAWMAPTSGRGVEVRRTGCPTTSGAIVRAASAIVLAAGLAGCGVGRAAHADNLLRIPGGWVWDGGSAVEVANGWVGSGWASFPGVNPPWNPVALPGRSGTEAPTEPTPASRQDAPEVVASVTIVPARMPVEADRRRESSAPVLPSIYVSARPRPGALTDAEAREAIGMPDDRELHRRMQAFVDARRAAAERDAAMMRSAEVPAVPVKASHRGEPASEPGQFAEGARVPIAPGASLREAIEWSAAGAPR